MTDRENPSGRELLDPRAAAEYLGLKPSGLACMRVNGTGPRYHKAGRLVRYRLEDLDAWLTPSTPKAKGA